MIRTVDALTKMAAAATNLLATGVGMRCGPRPAWLGAAVDFTIAGLAPGSTVVELSSPYLAATGGSPFAQGELWPVVPHPNADDTALDLASAAIREAQSSGTSGERFDASVLAGIVALGSSAHVGGEVSYCLTAAGARDPAFVLDAQACKRIARRQRSGVFGHGGASTAARPLDLVGTWPGNESVEELLLALREEA